MERVQLKDKWFEIFITEEVLLKEISRVAEQINEELKDKDPLFVCVLNGAFMFATELIGRFRYNCDVTFIRLQSYTGTQRDSNLRQVQGLVENVRNRHIIIVEDIIDTGHTMHHLINQLQEHQPASIRIATLLFKPNALQLPIQPNYAALSIPNDFIVGFGLDYNGHGRNLRNIYKAIPQ